MMNLNEKLISGLQSPVFDDVEAKFEKEKEFGKRLYATAWLVEIMAASLGLLIGFFVAFDAYYKHAERDLSTFLNALMGAMPFLLIAVIEPTKIPLAGGLYKVKSIGWKFLILISLIGLTTVTFETMFTGLERQLTNVTLTVTEGKNEIRDLNSKIAELEQSISDIEAINIADQTEEWNIKITTSQEQLETRISNIDGIFEAQQDDLLQQIATYEFEKNRIIEDFKSSQNLKLIALSDPINEIELQINEKISSISSLNDQLEEIRSSNGFNESIARLNDDIQNLRNRINQVENLFNSGEVQSIKQMQAIIGVTQDGNVGPATRRNLQSWIAQQSELIDEKNQEIDQFRNLNRSNTEVEIQRLNDRISLLENELSSLRENLEEKNSELSNARLAQAEMGVPDEITHMQTEEIRSLRADVENLRTNHADEINRIVHDSQITQQEYEDARASIETQLTEQKRSVPELRSQLHSYRSSVIELTRQLRSEAMTSQIYRFAQKYGGYEDILDVQEEDLSLIASIWFGSIALICAVVGTILALISHIMTDPDAFVEKQKNRHGSKFSRSLRKLALALRKKLLQKPKVVKIEVPTEVEKEIEVIKFVEKEVEKIIEITKEVFVPELIPIPIYLREGVDIESEMIKVNNHYADVNRRFESIATNTGSALSKKENDKNGSD